VIRYALVFDTETTGLWDRKAHPLADHQPWPVQYAAQLIDLTTWQPVNEVSILVSPPSGVLVGKEAEEITGISTELATRAGVDPIVCASLHSRLAARASVLVAHNIEFDYAVLSCLHARVTKQPNRTHGMAQVCTMKASQGILKLPASEKQLKWFPGTFKVPKLGEAYKHFTGQELIGAHDALVDVRACARVFRALQEGGHLPTF
jgi:DNA polymerase-3 subunit epsilon